MNRNALRITHPMNRREGSDPSAPRSLKNCRIEPVGTVRVHSRPVSTNVIDGRKPWVRFGDTFFDRYNYIDDFVFHASRFYTTSRRTTIGGERPVRSRRYDTSADGITETKRPAQVKSVTISEVKRHEYDNEYIYKGITSEYVVEYLIIPYNERGEAGPFCYYSFEAPLYNESGDAIVRMNDGYVPTLALEVSEETEYVDIFRTKQVRAHDYLIIEFLDDDNVTPINYDPTYYHLERIHATESHSLSVTDTKRWLPDELMQSGGEPLDMDKLTPVGPPLDRDLNLATGRYLYTSIEVTTDDNYSFNAVRVDQDDPTLYDFAANAMYMDGDRVMYGGVEWPTRPPQLRGVRFDQSYKNFSLLPYGTPHDFKLNYEYKVGNRVFLGPPTFLSDALSFNVAYQGETALRIYVKDGGEWKLLDRLTVDEQARYRANVEKHFDTPGSPAQTLSGGQRRNMNTSEPEGLLYRAHLYEPDAVMMSAPHRPLEVLPGSQFRTKDDGYINAIVASRLSEEEGLQNYQFYVFTTKGIYVANRQGENTHVLRVANNVGLKEFFIDDENIRYPTPLVTITKQGVCFVGSDRRIYFLSGRNLEYMDRDVPDIWYSTWPSGGKITEDENDYDPIIIEFEDDISTDPTEDDPPTVKQSIDDVVFEDEEEEHDIWLDPYFDNADSYSVSIDDETVVTGEILPGGTTLRLTSVAEGSALVTVTATNQNGSDDQTFAVEVLGDEGEDEDEGCTASPTQTQSFSDLQLQENGDPETLMLSQYFDNADSYTASSNDTSIVSVSVQAASLDLWPGEAGVTSVTVTAINECGETTRSFQVEVVA